MFHMSLSLKTHEKEKNCRIGGSTVSALSARAPARLVTLSASHAELAITPVVYLQRRVSVVRSNTKHCVTYEASQIRRGHDYGALQSKCVCCGFNFVFVLRSVQTVSCP